MLSSLYFLHGFLIFLKNQIWIYFEIPQRQPLYVYIILYYILYIKETIDCLKLGKAIKLEANTLKQQHWTGMLLSGRMLA
jgi:hypothetical protein